MKEALVDVTADAVATMAVAIAVAAEMDGDYLAEITIIPAAASCGSSSSCPSAETADGDAAIAVAAMTTAA